MDADGLDPAGFTQKLYNLYQLQKHADEIVTAAKSSGGRFVLSEELIKSLHKTCMYNLLPEAGEYRRIEVKINGSPHVPPTWIDVPAYMKTIPDYINENWNQRDLIHLAAFCLWRLNWVHPFRNGNGRIARTVSYLVMCAKHGDLLPAKSTVIKQITENKGVYNAVLTNADKVYDQTKNIDQALLQVEQLLHRLLTIQIRAALE